MKKNSIKLVAALSVMMSTSAIADDGFRFGLGVSGISSSSGSYETNSTVKVEAGYDFSNIVGLHASYEKVDGEYALKEFDGGNFKVGLDLGYKLGLSIVDVKPYAKVGASFLDISSDAFDELIDDGANVYYGLGVRGSIGLFYADLGAEVVDTGFDDTESVGSFTVGLIF